MRALPVIRRFTLAAFFSFSSAAIVANPASAQESHPLQAQKRLVADYQYGSQFSTPPYSSAQIPFHKVTHIIHPGVPFEANGNLQVPGDLVEPELITKAHAAGVKVLLLIGGDVTALGTNPAILKPLLANLKTFVKANDYDCIDRD